MKKFRCPQCGHNEFIAKVREIHEWRLDEEMALVEDLECYDAEFLEVRCEKCNALIQAE